MYSVVEFINDKSVDVVAKAWFYDRNCVMWLKNDRRRNILLERNEPPPSGTKVYPVRILKDNLTLDAARRLVHRAEDTSDLSFSESTEFGRGFRKKFVRRLTSDSEDDEDENIAEQQPVRPLAGWPSPPPILQLQTEKDASVAQSELYKSIHRELKSVRKKLDNVVHNQTVYHEEFRQHCALMVEKLGQIHASTVLVGPRPPALPLPLCTKDAYEDFEGKLNHDVDFREEVFSSFVNSSDSIRLNPTVGGCGHEMVRKTVINWFHGSRDRYGGRAKRRETLGGTSEDTRCPTLPPSEDTEPAVDAKTSSTPN
ncbi:hypothetical protein SprV_0200544000 [Sparganum proliferum]